MSTDLLRAVEALNVEQRQACREMCADFARESVEDGEFELAAVWQAIAALHAGAGDLSALRSAIDQLDPLLYLAFQSFVHRTAEARRTATAARWCTALADLLEDEDQKCL